MTVDVCGSVDRTYLQYGVAGEMGTVVEEAIAKARLRCLRCDVDDCVREACASASDLLLDRHNLFHKLGIVGMIHL